MATAARNPLSNPVHFPFGGLHLAVALTVALFGFAVWSAWRNFERLLSVQQEHRRQLLARGEILRLDEVLTMSAWMAVATGGAEWSDRYQANERALAALLHAGQANNPADIRAAFAALQRINDELVALERQVLAQVASGHGAEARRALEDPRYLALKRDFGEALDVAARAIDEHQREVVATLRGRLMTSVFVDVVLTVVLAAGWLTLLRAVRRQFEAQQELNRKLEGAIAWRESFLSIASHELRTPLSALGLQLSHLKHLMGDTAEPVRQRLDALARQVRRLTTLANNLLDASRIGADRLVLEPRPGVELRALLEEVRAELKADFVTQGISVELDAPSRVSGTWDPVRLRQVFTNLVSNACKYGGGRPVLLHLSEHEGVARVQVVDEGSGIPKDKQALIFERFERATNEQRHGGVGLGLWLAREIVRASGGRILVDSEPGQGATFTVLLPGAGSEPGLEHIAPA